MASVAAEVAKKKAERPEDYCPVKGCLWRINTARGPNPCQKHPAPKVNANG